MIWSIVGMGAVLLGIATALALDLLLLGQP